MSAAALARLEPQALARQPLDGRTLAAGLARLALAYGRELSEEQLTVYHEALADLAPDEFKAAVLEGIRELRFFPNPAELRMLAREARCRRNEADRERRQAEEAETRQREYLARQREQEALRAEMERFANAPAPHTAEEALRRLLVAARLEAPAVASVLSEASVVTFGQLVLVLLVPHRWMLWFGIRVTELAARALPGLRVELCSSEAQS